MAITVTAFTTSNPFTIRTFWTRPNWCSIHDDILQLSIIKDHKVIPVNHIFFTPFLELWL